MTDTETSPDHYQNLLGELRGPSKSLRRAIPETWAGFLDTHQAAMGEGAVSAALKEATALAISVVQRCDGCIAYHAKAAAKAGATADQVAELLGVALMMTGGTGSVYAPRAWEAFCEFSDELATAEVVR
jgi:AhpD family alkylhydroperoxidase